VSNKVRAVHLKKNNDIGLSMDIYVGKAIYGLTEENLSATFLEFGAFEAVKTSKGSRIIIDLFLL